MNLKEFYGEAPESTRGPRGRFDDEKWGRVVVERKSVRELLDSSCVVVNDLAKFYVSGKYHQIFEPEFLLSQVRLSVFGGGENGVKTRRVMVPSEYGRANVSGYCKIPYADRLIGRHIATKGDLLSGANYPTPSMENYSLDPIGLFGCKEAEIEGYYSNIALREGLRTAMVLGHVVMDPSVLADFIDKNWQPGRGKKVLQRALEIVEANGDMPAVLIRLGGVPERISMRTVCEYADYGHAGPNTSRGVAFGRALRFLGEEVSSFGVDQQVLEMGQVSRKVIIKLGEKLKRGDMQFSSEEEKDLFRWFFTAVKVEMQRASQIPGLGLVEDKDMDLTFVRYDYETAHLVMGSMDYKEVFFNWWDLGVRNGVLSHLYQRS